MSVVRGPLSRNAGIQTLAKGARRVGRHLSRNFSRRSCDLSSSKLIKGSWLVLIDLRFEVIPQEKVTCCQVRGAGGTECPQSAKRDVRGISHT